MHIIDLLGPKVFDFPLLLSVFSYGIQNTFATVLILVLFGLVILDEPISHLFIPTLQRIASNKEPSLLVVELAKTPFDIDITFNKKSLQLSAENWEGIGCEFRKYTNLSKGNGRKRLYKN